MRVPRTSGLAAALVLAHLALSAAEAQTVQRGSHETTSQEKGTATAQATLASPLPGAALSSGFGLRRHPILGVMMRHEGIDLAAPEGTPIQAAAAGVVVETGYEAGYGNFVRLLHPGGMETLYAHMSRIGTVAGAAVAGGDVIGLVGSTGLATGPHLHFEVRKNGAAVDPARSVDLPVRTAVSGTAFQARRPVDVVRGGRSIVASGGPSPTAGSAKASGVEVVRGGRSRQTP